MTSERPDLREGRWVRRICGLYPTEFRALLEDDLVERYGEERRRVSRTRGRVVARWWATRTLGALLLGAALEWIRTGSRRLRRGKDGGRGTREIATMWETWTRDVRIAFRSLVRSSPGFTAVALATLALGASATTTVYSVVDGTLVRPLPWPESGELVQVWEISDRGARNAASSATFLDWREQSRSFEHLVARSNPAFGGPITVLGGVEPVRVTVSRVTEGFFPMMGVRPRIGRFLVEGDHAPSAPAVAVVDHAFWLRQLGGDPSIAERTVEIGGRPFQVVGVMPPSFDFPRGTRIWVPMTLEPGGSRTSHNWLVNGRLRDGVSPAEAAVEMRALTAALARRHAADMETRSARVVPLREALYGDLTLPLLLLLGGASCVLLVACSNLASTLLARGRTRAREIAVRTALGATRGRVVRLLLTESGLLAVGGALLGGLLARPMLAAALAAGPPLLRDRVALDPRALGVASTACAVTVLAFGLFPALAATRTDLTASLRDGDARGGRRRRGWDALVAVEVALALVLVAGSTVLVRSFLRVLAVDPGFDATSVVTTPLSLPSGSYPDDPALAAAHAAILRAVRDLPGVESAGLVNHLPLGGVGFNGGFDDDRGEMVGMLDYRVAGPGYLDALGIPVLEGRGFVASDADGGDVALVSRSAAERYWTGESPVGQRIRNLRNDGWIYGTDRWLTIVGVVGDVRHDALTAEPRPTVYVHAGQRPARAASAVLVVRTTDEPASMTESVRAAIHRVDARLAVEPRPMESLVAETLDGRRFVLLVLGSFGAAALLLAGIGVYGVVSYTVARRTREMGIRMALGADPGRVLRMVVGNSLRTVVVGVVLGTAGALALGKVLAGLVYRIAPADPVSLVGAALLLLAAGTAASLIPGRRATRVDPSTTMRVD